MFITRIYALATRCIQKKNQDKDQAGRQTRTSGMSDDDFDDFSDEEFLQELDQRDSAINRQINETVLRRNVPMQRTLTGERLHNQKTQYEEIHQSIIFHPTHHDMDKDALKRYIYPSNYQVRDYQFDIIKKALFKNLLCAIPTGMGKTFIASTVMLNYYKWFKTGKIIFMAPTRPLVAQQIQACLGVTDIPSGNTAILLDKSRRNRPEIWESKRVFFTTPQVVENDLKTGILDPKDIVCLVIDEAHRARGNYAYTNVVKFIDRFNTSIRILALTATPAADIEGVQEVVNNLNISQIEIRTEESIDISKYMKRKDTVRIHCDMNSEMYDIVELLGEAIKDVLKQANEANIYDVADPSRINHFLVMQKSQAIIKNPTIPEGTKWKYFFILQVIGYVGLMLRRLKIYGVRTFYSYFQDKCAEFRTKFELGKSTNKTSASFFYHNALTQIKKTCNPLIEDEKYISHPKLEKLMEELVNFFDDKVDSRVIIFTELRESALEIVKCVDSNIGDKCKPHIFIGQAKGKEGFDQEAFRLKNAKKGRGKQKKLEREAKELELQEEREKQKKEDAAKRAASRTGTSEESHVQGMSQKTQKELIKKFKKGEINVLVATSIGEEGLDIGEVDMIICYDSTSSPIKNIQRMGRTGRKNDGKVILLLSGNEEQKFDQAMEEYANVQKKIAHGELEMIKSDRIIPKEIDPECVKKYIDIPEENMAIVRGEDEDDVIKHATQAMLGKVPRAKKTKQVGQKVAKVPETTIKPPKRFFMPDHVQTGFISSSKLVRKVGEDSSYLSNGDSSRGSANTPDNSNILGGLFDTPSESSKSSSISSSTKKTFYRPMESSTPVKAKHTSVPIPETIFSQDSQKEGMEKEIESDLDDIDLEPIRKQPLLNKTESVMSVKEQKDDSLQVFEQESASSPPAHLETSRSPDIDLTSSPTKTTPLKETSKSPKHGQVLSEEIFDSEFSDGDEALFTKAMQNIKRQKLKNEPLASDILTFAAFESPVEQGESFEIPYRKAEEAMDKEFDQDPEYSYNSLSGPITDVSQSLKPRVAKRRNDVNKRKKDMPVKDPNFDITKLLNNSNKRTLGMRHRRADVPIRASQVIDLENDFTQRKKPMVKKPKPRKLYMSQRDRIASIDFEPDEGFLNEEESADFFTNYYIPVEPDRIEPNPMISAKSFAMGNLKCSGVSQRFRNFITMTSQKDHRRLGKLIRELNRRAKLTNDDHCDDCDIVVKEDEIQTVEEDDGLKVKSEIGKDSDFEIIEEKVSDPYHSSISLLSDDDADFMNL